MITFRSRVMESHYAQGHFWGIEWGIKWAANLHLFAIEGDADMDDA